MRTALLNGTLLITFLLTGCSMFRTTPGTKTYNLGKFNKASIALKKEFDGEKRKNLKGELAFILGESCRKQNQPSKAASAYSKAIRYGYSTEEVYVNWGQALLKIGKTEEAQEAFKKALEIENRNKLARTGLKSCELILNNQIQTAYKIDRIKQLNSKHSNYSVAFDGENYDHIYFTSMRYSGKSRAKSAITGQGVAHLYESKKNTKGEWTKPEKLPEPLNSPYEEGTPYITPSGKEMYITRCVLDKTKIVEGQIYKMVKSAGIWSEPTKIELGGDSILFAHPALSQDEKTLYFASDMTGGRGGKDIWKITKAEGDEWGKPINLGFPINTAGDEMFPYIKEDETLYFASDGHPGFGGLDIYKTTVDSIGELTVQNLGTPINSSADDFGITFMGKSENGFFSSSRENTKGIDNIYSFILPELQFDLSLKVVNDRTQQPIKNSYLKLIGSDGTQLKVAIPSDGKLKLGLIKNCDYTMLIAAKGYMYQREKFTTSGLSSSKTIDFSYSLLPIDQAFALDDINFTTASSELTTTPEATISKLITLLNSNKEITLEISGYTDFTKEDNIDTEISTKRAQFIANQLIAKGTEANRIITKGYGNSIPLKVDERMVINNKFLKKGEVITEKTLSQLRSQKEIAAANQLLRRVEVKVIQKQN